MRDEQCWVIKKGGYYVNANFRVLFTGQTTGFTFYSNEQTMLNDLEKLGEGYYSDFINLKDVPKGERLHEIPIELASYWVCDEVPEGFENLITADKAYKLLYDEIRDEYYIFDDQGHNANYFLTTPGSFEC